MPIYHVKYNGKEHLIEAKNTADAIKHVTKPSTVEAKTLTATELVQHLQSGLTVEKANTK